MTLPATPFRKDHTGNGSTGPFLYDWKILSNTHLKIIKRVLATGIETVLILGVDYSVTGVGVDGGGNINLTDALTAAEKITILPNVPYEQDTDFTNQNSVKPEEAENMADKLGRQIKQVVEKMSRAVTLPESSTDSPVNYISQMNQIYADTIAAKNTTENARDTVLNNAGFIVVSADLLGADTIGTVAMDITNVNIVAGAIANVNATGANIASVNTVATNMASVNTVAGSIADVNAVAGNASNINAVAGNAVNINAVAGNSTNINTVAAANGNINTVVANMAAIIAAPTQAANAASSAALSQSWAVDAIGARPEGSAKYWSEIAQGFASSINIPSAVGNGLRFLRQKADETGFEYRTAAQVRSDISADTSEQGVQVGTIEHGLWSTPPAGRLELNGATGLLRADFPDLFAHLDGLGLIVTEGTKQSHEFGDGNGTTTFSLGDWRDNFIRAKSAARALGSYQADEFKAHTHGGIPYSHGGSQAGSSQYAPSITVFNQTGSTGGDETRPKNIALMATIKY